MKTCPRCNSQNDDAATYCVDCEHAFNSGGNDDHRKTKLEVPPVPPQGVEIPASSNRGRHTIYVPPPTESVASVAPRQERKILGVLVTYSWKPQGQVFPIYEGRNLIGRGPECEVQVKEDDSLSVINTHITFRKAFTIGDMVSMSGTDLNGTPIEEQFVPLPNYSKIRTGSTHWIFVAVQPQDPARP